MKPKSFEEKLLQVQSRIPTEAEVYFTEQKTNKSLKPLVDHRLEYYGGFAKNWSTHTTPEGLTYYNNEKQGSSWISPVDILQAMIQGGIVDKQENWVTNWVMDDNKPFVFVYLEGGGYIIYNRQSLVYILYIYILENIQDRPWWSGHQ